MPNFFDKKNLTPEQNQRWDSSVERYKQIQSNNFENYISSLSRDEKIKLMKDFNCSNDVELYEKSKQTNDLFYLVGDESSALFARLLNGQKPLLFPPPCAFSYPWYSVIEDNGPWEVNTFSNDEEDINQFKSNVKNHHQNEQYLIISQQSWKVLQYISNKEAIITYGNWEKLGFKWKLSLEKIMAQDSQARLICHHDKNVEKIVNIEQLIKEAQFQVDNKFSIINLIAKADVYQERHKKYQDQYGKGFGEAMIKQELQKAKNLIEERKKKNLSFYPSNEEIAQEVKKEVENFLKMGYTVDESGNLWSTVWRLHKIDHPDNVNIYAD